MIFKPTIANDISIRIIIDLLAAADITRINNVQANVPEFPSHTVVASRVTEREVNIQFFVSVRFDHWRFEDPSVLDGRF